MKEQLKREIFSIFEYARVLFNDYYNGKEEYSKEDLKNINNILWNIKKEIEETKWFLDILESESE